MSDTGRLPVLIDKKGRKYHGYYSISEHLVKEIKREESKIADVGLELRDSLVNKAILNMFETELECINQFNLYIVTRNYEDYTRKLFKGYLPFPMMYNQPLKFFNYAQTLSEHSGILTGQNQMFSFMSFNQAEAQTEFINDENSDEEIAENKPISSLHEKQILSRRRNREFMKEGQSILRSTRKLEHVLESLYKMNPRKTSGTGFDLMFDSEKISSSELLLFAYVQCFTCSDLPNSFILEYLKSKHPDLLRFVNNKIQSLDTEVDSDDSFFAQPSYSQLPTLFNELKYKLGVAYY